jgi:serine/threonine-protein kinase RsbW
VTETPENPRIPVLHTAVIKFSFPCIAEYVGIARLAILGIASQMAFSYDEVEDIRLAVGEACTHAVGRSNQEPGRAPTNDGFGSIWVECHVSDTKLIIDVTDDIPPLAGPIEVSKVDPADIDVDWASLGALLMEILVDVVEIDTQPTGTRVRLIKCPIAAP